MCLDTLPLFVTFIVMGRTAAALPSPYLQPRNPEFRPRITQAETPDEWRRRWQASKGRDINEVEAIAPMLALQTWPWLQKGLWLHWVDSASAQRALINGSASTESLNDIAFTTWDVIRDRQLYLWTERVPTHDNPLDEASRRDFRDRWRQGWVVDAPAFPPLWAKAQAC